MNKQHLYGLINPFERIAGLKALLWGLAGMVVSTALSFYSGWHYHGLLHFGPAPNPAWWCYAVEHLAVWLIPAVMFYLGGLLLSRSRIRMVDVLGTVVFAQLPLIVMNLFNFLPPMQKLAQIDVNMPPARDHATARIPCRDLVVACLFCLFDLGTGLDVPGIESVL